MTVFAEVDYINYLSQWYLMVCTGLHTPSGLKAEELVRTGQRKRIHLAHASHEEQKEG